MNKIIQKAIEGGWKNLDLTDDVKCHRVYVCDPSFWQALGKARKWFADFPQPGINNGWWLKNALHFHEINLTEGWDAAIKYLEDLIK